MKGPTRIYEPEHPPSKLSGMGQRIRYWPMRVRQWPVHPVRATGTLHSQDKLPFLQDTWSTNIDLFNDLDAMLGRIFM